MKPERRGLIALDGDGVLLDYANAYGQAWASFVGHEVKVIDPQAYFAHHRWGVPWLRGAELSGFQACFDTQFWSSIPAIEGALEACELLVKNGCELVCVTALHHEYRQARLANLQALGFPIQTVYTTPQVKGESLGRSPKADTLNELCPVAFVDDFLPYLRGISSPIHTGLVMRQPNGNPNDGQSALTMVGSVHTDLLDFARWWVAD